ncbi:MAG: hypothetical protein VZR33_07485 [Methanosphaera sp.]|nr:hypothetical protein [Methanosphaera sp.]
MEIKVTKKTIREFVKNGEATDITNISFKDAEKLRADEGWLDTEFYSMGVYGCNGCILKGHNTGNRYAITNRTQALFFFS